MPAMTTTAIDAAENKAAPPMVAIRDLCVSFTARGQTQVVLDRITIDVSSGEFFVIVGPSGCGKTTLLRMVQGLARPSAGTITVDGRAVSGPGADRGFVFQNDSLYPWRSVWRNVILGLELQGVPRRRARSKAQEMIDLVGLGGYENHYPHELSGGMRQRVNLARAMAIEPKILLMDEPFAALDALTRETMQEELLRIRQAAGTTVLFITHQIDEAVYLGDRVAVLGARPGHLKDMVTVSLPRPRPLAVKQSAEFQTVMARIAQQIGSQH